MAINFEKIKSSVLENKVKYIGFTFLGIYLAFSLPAIIDYYFKANFVIIGWTRYTEKDIAKEMPDVYGKLKKDYVNSLNYAFDEFITRKIVEIEAKSKNLKPEEFLLSGQPAYTPTDAEIEAVYNQYKAQLKGKTLNDVKGDIKNALRMRKDNDSKNSVIAGVKEKYKSKIRLHVESIPEQRLTVEEKGNPSIGPKDAKVTIVEFSDFECPYCQRSQSVNKELRNMYKDKIRWVFRDYPLPFHENAKFAHIAANCAIPQG